ncbi:MAG: outer membrane lipoprotein carrier protein LolA [Bacteroidales bacterium]
MYRLLVIMVFLTGYSALFSQTILSADQRAKLQQQLTEKSDETNTISCQFKQTKQMAVLAIPSISSGCFYYKKEAKICLEYALPKGDKLVMSGDDFLIISNGKRNSADARSNPMMRGLKNLLVACMSGDIAQVSAGAKSQLEYAQTETQYLITVRMDHKRKKAYIKEIILCFEKSDLSLSSLKMIDPSGDFTLYEFDQKRFNEPVNESLFKI